MSDEKFPAEPTAPRFHQIPYEGVADYFPAHRQCILAALKNLDGSDATFFRLKESLLYSPNTLHGIRPVFTEKMIMSVGVK